MRINDLIFGYFSPEVLLPVTSILATVAGIFMMLGRRPYRFIIRAYHWINAIARRSE